MNEVITPEVAVNHTEYGITEQKANELVGNLPEIKSEREVLTAQYKEVIVMDIDNPETSKAARALRLLIQKNRTQGILAWHKTTKEVFLRGGQFIDAIKNKEIAVNERMEEQLEQIEKHFEIQEQKRKDELHKQRIELLQPYAEFAHMGLQYGAISQDEFDKLFNGAKLQFDAKQERIKIEEEAARQADLLRKRTSDRLNTLIELAMRYDGKTFVHGDIELVFSEVDRLNDEDFDKLFQETKARKEEIDFAIAKEAKAEEERKQVRAQRAEEVKPFIMFIQDYDGILVAEPENYSQLLQQAKEKKTAHEESERKRKEEEEATQIKLMKDRLAVREQMLFNIGAHKQADQYFIDCLNGSVMNISDAQCLVDEQFDRVFASIKKRIEDFESAEELKKQKAIEAAEKKANRAPDKQKLESFLQYMEKPKYPAMKTQEGINALQEIVEAYNRFISVINEQIESL